MKDGRLEASDLMAGDWCTSPDLNNKPAYWTGNIEYYKKQVEGPTIWYKRYEFLYSGGGEGAMVPDSRIFPIPLTKEILEKIEFEASKYFKMMYWSKSYDEFIKVSELEEGHLYLEAKGKKGRYEGDCNFLHELQHALRLCGITREIIL